MLTRRRLLAAAVQLAGAGLTSGCGLDLPRQNGAAAVLAARPAAPLPDPPVQLSPLPGTRPLGLVAPRDALLHVPVALPAGEVPFVVVLHGAGQDASAGLDLLRPLADEHRFLLLAPASRRGTWDAVLDGYGPDVAVIDRALAAVFAAFPVDAGRVALAGFSDGGSYALGLGLANGTLFRRVAAFSPGFRPTAPRHGQPPVFISHGDADDVLPVDRTSRRIVPALRADGLEVTYREFHGPHTVPPEVAREAVGWLGWPGR